MWRASIIDSYLIDFYIPFLPLERKHVRQCVKAEMGKYKFVDKMRSQLNNEEDIDSVVEALVYEPIGYEKFSSSGCKKIPNLVRNLIVEKEYHILDEL